MGGKTIHSPPSIFRLSHSYNGRNRVTTTTVIARSVSDVAIRFSPMRSIVSASKADKHQYDKSQFIVFRREICK